MYPKESKTTFVIMLRHILEDEVVALLEEAGFNVHSQQLEVGSVESGWLGHIDGIIDFETPFGVPKSALLEIKTANARRFGELVEMDSYAAWSPGYAAQLQAYMMHLPVEEALVVVYNKDTSELYHETVLFDVDEASLVPGQNMDIFPGKIFRRQSGVTGTAINGLKFPNTAPENIQMYQISRQLADEETGIP